MTEAWRFTKKRGTCRGWLRRWCPTPRPMDRLVAVVAEFRRVRAQSAATVRPAPNVRLLVFVGCAS